jgi:hypothetical protein
MTSNNELYIYLALRNLCFFSGLPKNLGFHTKRIQNTRFVSKTLGLLQIPVRCRFWTGSHRFWGSGAGDDDQN